MANPTGINQYSARSAKANSLKKLRKSAKSSGAKTTDANHFARQVAGSSFRFENLKKGK